jgi:hypothetical protein
LVPRPDFALRERFGLEQVAGVSAVIPGVAARSTALCRLMEQSPSHALAFLAFVGGWPAAKTFPGVKFALKISLLNASPLTSTFPAPNDAGC